MNEGGFLMRVVSLFSGIGAFEKALTNLGIEHDVIRFSEIDKYAITSYCAIHNVNKELNLGDITEIDPNSVPSCDLITHGSPCTDYSVAGKGEGGDEGSGTRSSLMWHTVDIVTHKKPRYVIWENVKGVLNKKHRHNFDKYLNDLESLGYNNYYEVLNSKNYGIPQNRERVYVVSIRKDIDDGSFTFPEPFDNGLRLKDLLEDEVEEKYYIDNEKTRKLLESLKGNELIPGGVNVSRKGEVFESNTEVASCLLARDYKGLGNQSMTAIAVPCITPDRVIKKQNGRRFKTDGEPMFTLTAQDRHGILQVGQLESSFEQSGRVYDPEGVAPTVMGNSHGRTTGGYNSPKIVESSPKRLRGLYDKEKSKHQAGSVWDKEEIAPTIDTCGGGQREPLIIEEGYVEKKYKEFIGKNGYIPEAFNPYNCQEVTDIAPTVTTQCGSTTSSSTILFKEENELKFVGGIGEKDWVGDGKDLSRNFPQGNRVYDSEGIACSQTSNGGGIGGSTGLYNIDFKIRKLTPKECWRLMAFSDEDYEEAKLALMEEHYNGRDRTNSQMYKMAGNSITVCVLEEIYKKLFKDLILQNGGDE